MPKTPIAFGVVLLIAALWLGQILPAQTSDSYTVAKLDYPSSLATYASGIDITGRVVGSFVDGAGTHGFLFSNGAYSAIDYPGVAWTSAYGINNAGLIVGAYGDSGRHGFILSNGAFSTFDVPGGSDTVARDVNSFGQIVGDYAGADGVRHGFLLSGGSYNTVEPPGTGGSANGINDAGQIVGFAGSGANGSGFLFSQGTYSKVSLPESLYSVVNGLNNLGELVGQANGPQPPFQGFRRTASRIAAVDLPGPPSSWDARDVNDLGQVVGSFTDSAGQTHGYRANPPTLKNGPTDPGALTRGGGPDGPPAIVAVDPAAVGAANGNAAPGTVGNRGAGPRGGGAGGAGGRGGTAANIAPTPVQGTLEAAREALRRASAALQRAATQANMGVAVGGQAGQGPSVQRGRTNIEIGLIDMSSALALVRTQPNAGPAPSTPASSPNFTAPPRPAPNRNANMEEALAELKNAFENFAKAPGGDLGGLRVRVNADIDAAAKSVLEGINIANAEYAAGNRGAAGLPTGGPRGGAGAGRGAGARGAAVGVVAAGTPGPRGTTDVQPGIPGGAPVSAAAPGPAQPAAAPADAPAGLPLRRITLLDRNGAVVNAVETPVPANMMSLSPDGTRVAFPRIDNDDIIVLDLASKTETRIATRGRAIPAWSPDGRHIAYLADRNGTTSLFTKASDGTGSEELLLPPATMLFNWSTDGQFIIVESQNNFVAVPPVGDHKPTVIFTTNGRHGPNISPDSRFLAYLSNNETGSNEVWVRTLDPKDPTKAAGTDGLTHWRISRTGVAGMIRWRRDGKELYYLAPDGNLMMASIAAAPEFKASSPTPLFRTPAEFPLQAAASVGPGQQADVSADGQRFLFLTPANSAAAAGPVNVGGRGNGRGNGRGGRGN